MHTTSRKSLLILAVVVTIAAWSFVAGAAAPGDWPQWRGPDRTGISTETGLLKAWPAAGPAQAWSISGLGRGYGSPAVAGDRIYVQGSQGKNSAVFCLKRADGTVLWSRTLGQGLDQDRGGGPRGTPTVDGDLVYALSESGDLVCLQAGTGAVVWTRNLLKDFGGANPEWLFSESPLVDGANLVITPGGPKASIAALDKLTGKTVWTTNELSDPAGYSSCIVVDIQGVRTIMTMTAQAGVGVRAADGKLMWRSTSASNTTANVATPVFYKDTVFYTSAYKTGAALLRLQAENGVVKAQEAYFTREMMNHHGGVIVVDGYLYGFSNAILTCLELGTGKVMWRDRSVGKGSLTYADGHLYLLGEGNTVGLAEATPKAYVETGRFRITDQGWPSWAHPTISQSQLLIRNQGVLTSYDIKAK